MKISVVVVTYKRSKMLARCLESLKTAAQTCPEVDIEYIIGINGQDHETEEQLKLWQKVIKSVQKRFPAEFRNELVSHARGDWIYFIDDDAFVDVDHFTQFIKIQREVSDAVVLGGPNLTPPDASWFEEATGLALASRFATFISSARYKKEKAYNCGEEALILCNLFVLRRVLPIKPFPEKYLCCEENFLMNTLKNLNFQFHYDPRLMVWHHRRKNGYALFRQVYLYAVGRGQMTNEIKKSFHPAHLVPSLCLLYVIIALSLNANWLWLGLPFTLYFLLCIVFSSGKPTQALVFSVIHLGYGIGFIRGVFKR